MDQNVFIQTLEHVLTPDTAVVKEATASLRQYYSNPESLSLLVSVARSHPNSDLRQLAAVEVRSLVKRFWGKKNAEPKINDAGKAQIRESLLHSATQDEVTVVRHSAARAIAAIAAIDIPQGMWLELPNIILQAASSGKVSDREVGTYLLHTLLETMGDVLADRWRDIVPLCAKLVNDNESVLVRLNTLLTLGGISQVVDTDECPEVVAMFKDILPSMVNVLKQVAESGNEEHTGPAFETFEDLLMASPPLIAAHLRDLIEFFSNLSINKDLRDEVRARAISWLMSCLRYRKMKMQALRVGESLALRAMEIVTEFKSEDEEDEDTSPARSALQLIDFLASALPPAQVIVPVLNAAPRYVSHQEPSFRRAGVLAIGNCVEGAPDFVATQLPQIFGIVLQLLNDPDVRVRSAALYAVTQLADEMSEELGKEHARLIPLLIHMLETGDNADAWVRACSAIDAVLTGVDQADVQTYLPNLMPKLSHMFGLNDFKLKAAAVGCIGSAALAGKDSFAPYFQDTVNALSPFLSIKGDDEQLDLRGVVLDCMGSIAEAVGTQAFTPYVPTLMQTVEESLTLGNTRLRETAFMFLATIAKLYGEEFAPFLPMATKALFDSLGQEDKSDEVEIDEELVQKIISVGSSGSNKAAVDGVVSMDDDDDDDDSDWDDLDVVNAVALEKEVAAETLGEILANCKHGYLPYLEQTVTALAAKVSHPYEGLRRACISTLWRAYGSLWQVSEERGMAKWRKGLPLAVHPTEELQKLGGLVVSNTLEVLKNEPDRNTVRDICYNIAATLNLCGPALLSDGDGKVILELATQIVLILQKQHPSQLPEWEDEEDMPNLEENAEYDWAVIDACMDLCLGLGNALGAQYESVWKIISQNLIKYASSSDSRERSTSVGAIAESIKYMGEAITESTDRLMKLLLHKLSDEDHDTKANAAYALGLLCLNSKNESRILSGYPDILRKLESVFTNSANMHPRVLDNAAGCVARMIIAHPESVPLGELLSALVSILPLKEDYEENEPVYSMLIKLYQNHDQTVFSLTQQFVPVLSKVLGPPEEQLTPELRGHLVELIKFLAQKDASVIQDYPNLIELSR